ncbi:MAG: hypothetical protein ACI4PF_02825 [Christensenellales bacterium]
MAEKKFKTKDMIIAIFCTLLAILCIVFYFLPAFNVKHSASPMMEYEVVNYSAWEITVAAFTKVKVLGVNWEGLMYIKDTYGFAIILSGVLMPLAIICSILTAVFAYLSWLKGEKFKKFCFLFSLCGMIFQTITLISTWFIAMVTKDGNNYNFFQNNLKGGMSYASFVSLILAFVIAIIACAYNYFLENADDEDDEESEEEQPKKRKVKYVEVDEDDDDDEEVVVVRKKKSSSKTNATKAETEQTKQTAKEN